MINYFLPREEHDFCALLRIVVVNCLVRWCNILMMQQVGGLPRFAFAVLPSGCIQTPKAEAQQAVRRRQRNISGATVIANMYLNCIVRYNMHCNQESVKASKRYSALLADFSSVGYILSPHVNYTNPLVLGTTVVRPTNHTVQPKEGLKYQDCSSNIGMYVTPSAQLHRDQHWILCMWPF